MSEVRTVPLGELVDPDRGISYGVVQPGAEAPDGVPIIRVTDVRDGRISSTNPLRVSAAVEAKYQRTRLRGGEVLLTLVGTVGETAIVPDTLRGWNTARAVGVIPVLPAVGARWIHLALRTPQVREFIQSHLNTTVQATLNLRDVVGLPIPLPAAQTRDAVISILGALDDKIDANRQMNETLEELGRTVFKSWFVDFDPVRANAEGRQPVGMDAETAALFPSRFVDSELGEIPKGWEVTNLAAICEAGGGDIQTGPFGSQLHASDYVPEGVPSVMPKDLKEDRISRESVARIREEDASRLSRYRLRLGDIIYSRRGDVERSALVTSREDGWLCGTGCLRVRPGSSGANSTYLFAAVTTDRARAWVVRHAHGATMPNLNTTILGELPLVLPATVMQEAYHQVAGPLVERRDHNWAENESLATVRDLLLPKLISGELRVAEAEKLAEAAL